MHELIHLFIPQINPHVLCVLPGPQAPRNWILDDWKSFLLGDVDALYIFILEQKVSTGGQTPTFWGTFSWLALWPRGDISQGLKAGTTQRQCSPRCWGLLSPGWTKYQASFPWRWGLYKPADISTLWLKADTRDFYVKFWLHMCCMGEVTGIQIRGPHRLQRDNSVLGPLSFSQESGRSIEQPRSGEGRVPFSLDGLTQELSIKTNIHLGEDRPRWHNV